MVRTSDFKVTWFADGEWMAEHPGSHREGILRWFDALCFPSDEAADFHRGVWWLAQRRDDCQLAGYGQAYVVDGGSAVFLSRAGVHPGFRGLGIQVPLIRVRERWAQRQPGARRVITYVSRTNVASANNLIKAGYRLYVPSREWGSDGALYFFKWLKPQGG